MKSFIEYLNEADDHWHTITDKEFLKNMWNDASNKVRSAGKQADFLGNFSYKGQQSIYYLFKPTKEQMSEFGKNIMQAYSDVNDAWFIIKYNDATKRLNAMDSQEYAKSGKCVFDRAVKPAYMNHVK